MLAQAMEAVVVIGSKEELIVSAGGGVGELKFVPFYLPYVDPKPC